MLDISQFSSKKNETAIIGIEISWRITGSLISEFFKEKLKNWCLTHFFYSFTVLFWCISSLKKNVNSVYKDTHPYHRCLFIFLHLTVVNIDCQNSWVRFYKKMSSYSPEYSDSNDSCFDSLRRKLNEICRN